MRRPFTLVAALAAALLVLPAGADDGGAAEVARVSVRIARANRLIDAWQFAPAAAIAQKLYAEHPSWPPVEYLAGKVKFYEHDYKGAVALFSRATAALPPGHTADPIVKYARDTEKLTRGYVARRSKHFEVRVPPGVDEVLWPYALDTLEKTYQRVGADFDYYPKQRVVVEVYSTAADLSKATGLSVSAIKTSGTIAICKYNKLMITSPKALLRGYKWLDTVSHEYVHYVVSSVSHNTVPIWLHEGFAKYEETRWDGAGGRAMTPYAEHLLADAIAGKRKFITFAQMHPSMALLPSQDATALAFAEVESVLEYLVHDKGGYPTVRKIIAGLRSGDDDSQAIEAAVGQPLPAFERSWKAWLKKRPLSADAHAKAHRLTFKEDAPGRVPRSADKEADAGTNLDSPQAKRFAHLGELLRMRGRNAAAAVEYKKAYAIAGAAAPLLSDKLALTLMNLKSYDDAERVLEASLGPNPDFVTTYVHLGRLYYLTHRPDEAEAAYLKANALNPFDPEIHAALATLYKDKGDTALERREARAYAIVTEAPRGDEAPPPPDDVGKNVGYLSIHSTPWAHVVIDGKDTGMTTPLFRFALPAGPHQVTLEADGPKAQKAFSVKIVKGDEKKLVVKLD